MKAVIIGGGIIGLSSAYYLKKKGWDITIVDRTDLSDSCSYGNLGMIVPSHFVPLAAPGILAQGIRWMFDAKSPFYVKPSLDLQLIQWGLRFIKSATAVNVKKSAPYLLESNLLSKKLYEELSREPGFDFAFEKKGILMYFKSEKVAAEEIHLAEKARAMGLDVVTLNSTEAQALEPNLALDVLGAVHYRSDAHLYPNKLNQQLIANLQNGGTEFIKGDIQHVKRSAHKIEFIRVGDREIKADTFVFAAGSWLPQLLKPLGISLPLMPGKGYSFNVDAQDTSLNIPAILCEARVAITPMNNQIRFGGTMEIGTVNDQINMKRVQGIVESIPEYMPGLQVQMPAKEKVWYGFRPCSPDGLPYIGFSKQYNNLLIAGGHAMMGLSLGPITGLLIADLANGESTIMNIKAFDPGRFS
jgi:D-amino-acid dehydrogenase